MNPLIKILEKALMLLMVVNFHVVHAQNATPGNNQRNIQAEKLTEPKFRLQSSPFFSTHPPGAPGRSSSPNGFPGRWPVPRPRRRPPLGAWPSNVFV